MYSSNTECMFAGVGGYQYSGYQGLGKDKNLL